MTTPTPTPTRPGMIAWWRESPTCIYAGVVERIEGSIVVMRRCGATVELHTKRVHAQWEHADADSPLPAGERSNA